MSVTKIPRACRQPEGAGSLETEDGTKWHVSAGCKKNTTAFWGHAGEDLGGFSGRQEALNRPRSPETRDPSRMIERGRMLDASRPALSRT